MNNEYITYGIFIIYNLCLVFGIIFAFKKYKDFENIVSMIDSSITSSDAAIQVTRKDLTDLKKCIRDYELNEVVETVKRLKEFFIECELNEFSGKFKWMEDIVSKLECIDAASKVEEHEEILDQFDIRDINDTISELASEEYVNRELEDLQCNITEQSDRIDWLEKIIDGFRNVLNDKDL